MVVGTVGGVAVLIAIGVIVLKVKSAAAVTSAAGAGLSSTADQLLQAAAQGQVLPVPARPPMAASR